MQEVLLITQVRCPRGGPRRVVGEVIERLVMELEQLVRAVGIRGAADGVGRIGAGRAGAVAVVGTAGIPGGIVPATRVPGPIDTTGAELVADRHIDLAAGGYHQGWEPAPVLGSRSIRLVPRLRRVHGEITANDAGRGRRTNGGRAA